MLSWTNSPKRDLTLILIVTALPVTPMIFLGYHWGHDLKIHLQSWMDAAAQLRQGIFFPRWASQANYGLGEPRFIFYPPASWTLGGIFGLLLPWRIVPAICVWITMLLAALTMRKLAAEWLSPRAALLAGLLYALNPYMLVSAYARSAYPEMLASALFPLLLWGIALIERDTHKAFAITAISFAAIWLSNLPAGVIAGYSLAFLLVTISVLRRTIKPLLYGFAAAIAGIGLAAFTLLPAAWEQRWVYIDAVVRPNQLPMSNFLFSPPGVASMYKFNHQLSPLAVFLMIGALASAAAASRIRYSKPAIWWSLTTLCAVSAFLMFPLSAPIWRSLPELRFVQFPWRWFFPMCAAAALLLTFAIVQSRAAKIVVPLIVLGLIAIDATIVHAEKVTPHFVDDVAQKFHSQHGYDGLLEYTPLTSEGRFLPVDAVLVEPADPRQEMGRTGPPIHLELWSPEKKVIDADLPQATAVNLKLLAYPAWRASVNGKPFPIDANPRTGQITIVLPAGTSRTEVIFARTWDRTAGIAISLGTGIALIGLWAFLALTRRRAAEPSALEAAPAQAA